MIKVGIAGARGLSGILALKEMPNVDVVALCDLDKGILDEEAKRHGIPKTYRIYEDMLECDIDAVIVATPCKIIFNR